MRVVLLVLIVLWSATAQARWVGTAEQWADLQSRDAYGDMGNWFNSLPRAAGRQSSSSNCQRSYSTGLIAALACDWPL
jgi:hypothetical protein